MKDSYVKTILVDTLGTVDKGRDKQIVIRLMEVNGYRYLDMRTFLLVNGSWQATGKGLTLSRNNFDSFLGVLNQKQELLDDGLDPMTAEEFDREINRIKPRARKSVSIRKGESGIKKSVNNNQSEFNFNKKEVQDGDHR